MRRPGAAALAVVALALAGQAAAGTWTMRKGETLSAVARRNRTTVAELARINGINDIHRVQAGTVLRLTATAPRPVLRTTPAVARPPRKVPARLPAKLRRAPGRLALWGHFDDAAARYGVPADLLKATAWQESGWQNDKVSATGALGIGQLMPDTVDFVNEVLLRGARLDPGRPEDNVRMSARFLRYVLDQSGGDVAKALGAYYQGLASMRRQGPLPQTKAYVAAVVAQRPLFR